MKRKAKTGQTPDKVLRFDRAVRAPHRPVPGRDRRQPFARAEATDAPPALTWKAQWRKRKELLRYIVGRHPDLRRIDLMHRLLQADAATLVRIVEAMGE